MLGVMAEVALGLWLISGWWQPEARAAALAFFTLLAAVSLWLAAHGQSTCGCFGRVHVHPWATFGFDVAALTACRPGPLAWPTAASAVRGAAPPAAGAATLLAVGGLGLMAHWGVGAEGLVARLRGQSVAVSPHMTDLGREAEGVRRVFRLTLANYSGRDVRLVGGSASCACAVLDELPVTLPAGESREVSVRAAFRGTPGRFQHEVWIYTDLPDQPLLVARFGGAVLAAD